MSILACGLGVAVAAMVFCFVLGSSSVPRLVSFGHSARWGMLAIVWCLAGAAVWASRHDVARLDLPAHTLATLVLAALALASAGWSVAPHATVGRALSLWILATAAPMLAVATALRPALVPWVLGGALAGSLAAGLLGALLVLVDYQAAVQGATVGIAARYRGLGENPNTYSMLAAVTTPVAAWAIFEGRDRWHRFAGGLAGVVFVLSISFSGSRGAFLAALVGSLAFVLARPDLRRQAAVAGTCAVFAVAFGLALIPRPTGTPAAMTVPTTTGATPAPTTSGVTAPTTTAPTTAGTVPTSTGSQGGSGTARPAVVPPAAVDYNPGRLQDEVYRPLTSTAIPQAHLIFGTSGRVQAWGGAIQQANERPLLGYGFGTEDRVFIDRFYSFEGARPENSWVGIYLQLGGAGVLLLVAFWVTLVPDGWRVARRRAGGYQSSLLGICLAGLALTVPQSYLYSVGNVATALVWIAAAMLAFSTLPRGDGAFAR